MSIKLITGVYFESSRLRHTKSWVHVFNIFPDHGFLVALVLKDDDLLDSGGLEYGDGAEFLLAVDNEGRR